MSAAASLNIVVTDHALWRAAERFRESVFADRIVAEVRAALAAGRVSRERAHLGLAARPDPSSLYVWTADERRVYSLRVDRWDDTTFVVTTTMRPGQPRLVC